MSSEGTHEPSGDPTGGSERSQPDFGDAGGPAIMWPSTGSAPNVDPPIPAWLAPRELMTHTAEGSRWGKRAALFILAALVGSMFAVVLASVH